MFLEGSEGNRYGQCWWIKSFHILRTARHCTRTNSQPQTQSGNLHCSPNSIINPYVVEWAMALDKFLLQSSYWTHHALSHLLYSWAKKNYILWLPTWRLPLQFCYLFSSKSLSDDKNWTLIWTRKGWLSAVHWLKLWPALQNICPYEGTGK